MKTKKIIQKTLLLLSVFYLITCSKTVRFPESAPALGKKPAEFSKQITDLCMLEGTWICNDVEIIRDISLNTKIILIIDYNGTIHVDKKIDAYDLVKLYAAEDKKSMKKIWEYIKLAPDATYPANYIIEFTNLNVLDIFSETYSFWIDPSNPNAFVAGNKNTWYVYNKV